MRRSVGFAAVLVFGATLLAAGRAAVTPPPGEASPRVEASVSENRVKVAQRFVVRVRALAPGPAQWSFPAEPGSDAVRMRRMPPAPDEGADEARYEARALAVSEAEVPSIEVGYRLPDGTEGKVATEPIPLRIVSVLPKEEEKRTLAEVRGPLEVGPGRAFWIAVGTLAALLVVLLFVVWRRWRRRELPAEATVSRIAPGEEALAALVRLGEDGLAAKGELRAHYVRLAEILKRYLERQLRHPILEMTTAETLRYLREHPVGGIVLPTIRDVVTAADRVKFARGQAAREEAEAHLVATRRVVERIEELMHATEPPAGEEAAA